MAAAIYGNKWKGYNILCKSDNQAVVAVLKSRYASDKTLMHLHRILFFFEAHFGFHITAQHIAGVHNTHANNISTNKHAEFLKAHQGIMPPSPTPIPPLLTDFFSAGRIIELGDDVQQLFKLGIAPATHKTFSAALKIYSVL